MGVDEGILRGSIHLRIEPLFGTLDLTVTLQDRLK